MTVCPLSALKLYAHVLIKNGLQRACSHRRGEREPLIPRQTSRKNHAIGVSRCSCAAQV